MRWSGLKSLKGVGEAWTFLLRVTTRGFFGELAAGLGKGLGSTTHLLRWRRLKAFVRFKANPALSRTVDPAPPLDEPKLIPPYRPPGSVSRDSHPPAR